MLPYERLKDNEQHRTDGRQSLFAGKGFSTDVANSSLAVNGKSPDIDGDRDERVTIEVQNMQEYVKHV